MHRVSQSAATQIVRQLERELGVELIDRTRRPLGLSPAGQFCFDGYREVLERCDAIQKQIHSRGEQLAGEVRVAAIYSVGLYAMNRCMQDFMRQHPKAKVRLEFLPPNRVYDAVRRNDADLGVLSYPRGSRTISVIPLRSEQMALVCPPTHRLTRIRKVTIDQLQGEAFVMFEAGLIIRREVQKYLRRHGVRVQVAMEFDNIETIKQAVEIGAGISILPAPTVQAEVKRGTLAIGALPLPDLQRPLGILHRTKQPLSRSVRRLAELLQASESY